MSNEQTAMLTLSAADAAQIKAEVTPAIAAAKATSIAKSAAFVFTLNFIEALNANDNDAMRLALSNLRAVDEAAAIELRPQYLTWKNKNSGWTDLYTKFQLAIINKHQAQAAGYLSRIHQKFPQREAAVRTEFDKAFPKK